MLYVSFNVYLKPSFYTHSVVVSVLASFCAFIFALVFSSSSILQNDLDDPERGMIFVCSATHKTKSMFFFLAQTEQGDIFKVTLETDEEMVNKPLLHRVHTIVPQLTICAALSY